jgi:CubicO group peptidase (beta-lactamase class C family)
LVKKQVLNPNWENNLRYKLPNRGNKALEEKTRIKLEEHMQKIMETVKIPGAAIAISRKGEMIFQRGFGFRNIETKQEVTPETIFGIASVTKSFTAMAILKLEEEGKLSVHDPVTKYIPEFWLHGVPDMNEIKILHLLSHTTGLPPMKRREELNKLTDHITYLNDVQTEMLGKPGEYFSYCNDTFLLLGIIIERLTGQLYRRYVTEKIINPLQMHRSTFSLEEIAKLDNVSVPYVYNKKTDTFEKQDWPVLGNYEVGGGIRSNVLDLIKYGLQFLGNGRRVISHSQINKMMQPVYQISKQSSYGLALTITPDHFGRTLVTHGGGQPGVSSHFGFVPEEDIVVAVLTNVSDAPGYDLLLAAVNAVLDLPLDQKQRGEQVYETSYEELLPLAGTYSSDEGGQVTISVEDALVRAEIGEERFLLRPAGKNTLVIEGTEKQLHFYFKNEQQAWAVLFGLRMLRRQ